MGSFFSEIAAIATLAYGPAATATLIKLQTQRQCRRQGSYGTQLVTDVPSASPEEG
jgi:hypothetical protein